MQARRIFIAGTDAKSDSTKRVLSGWFIPDPGWPNRLLIGHLWVDPSATVVVWPDTEDVGALTPD